MRKILAILLAMLMLLSAAAVAEGGAAVLTLDNMKIETWEQKAAANDLSMSLVLENVNALPSIALLVDGGSEPLVTAVGQLTSKAFNFAIDGMGYGYTADIPAQLAAQLAHVGDAGMAVLVPNLLPVFDQIVLPAFTGVDIPKADMTGLLSGFMTGANTFEIPYEQVNALLDQVLQVAKAQGSTVENLDEAIEMLEQLKASGMGIAIRGEIADDGATQTVTGNIHLAQNGTVSDDASAALTVTSSRNNFKAAVSMSESGISLDLMTVTLVSDPAASRLDINLDVLGGGNASFALFTEDGLQKATLNIKSSSDTANLEFAYGQQSGSDVVFLRGVAGGDSIDFIVSTAMGTDGVRTGSLALAAGGTAITGDVTMYIGDEIDLSGFAMPSDLRPIDQMDTDGLVDAFGPVMEYIENNATMG